MGLTTAISLGLAAPAVTTAAPPLQIQPGSHWTVLIPPQLAHNNNCVVLNFAKNHTFRGLVGESGKWSGGGNKVTISWTSPAQVHYVLRGTFTKKPVEEFTGTLTALHFHPNRILLIKGFVPGCRS
jgi:hypothetical protein